jgi:hydrogenase 3 maturation protease
MIMIWGIGNPLHGDDAAGVAVAERLFGMSDRGVCAVVCETTPENYIGLVRKKMPSTLVLVDAMDMGLAPGDFRRVIPEDCAGISFSSHGIAIPLLLGFLPKEVPVLIIGIQPGDTSPFSKMTPGVEYAVKAVCTHISAGNTGSIPLYHENLSPR